MAHRCGPRPARTKPPATGRTADEYRGSPGLPLNPIPLALGASLAWGIGDFLGGLNTRRLSVLTVLLVSQSPTLLLLLAIVWLRGRGLVPGGWIVAGAIAGLAGLGGLAAFYRGMAVGVVSIVAAIAATAPLVPIVTGILKGERPAVLQLLGVALALAGVVLLAFDRRPQSKHRFGPGVGLAMLAALSFGIFLVAIAVASRPDPFAGLVAMRASSVATLVVLALLFRSRVRLQPGDAPALVLVGVLDVSADILYSLATTLGLLTLVSILASLYPVATVLLARVVLGERLATTQRMGILLAFGGVVLIST